MKKAYLILLLNLTGALILSEKSLAYLDPGTGGIILGSIWPLAVALFSAIGAFFVKVFWKPIKGAFSKILKRNG